jgi:cell surface protein SprA
LKRLGRAKSFSQEMRFTYRLPLDKFFLLDWMTADAKYNNQFNYQAVSLNILDEFNIPFGNTISNGKDRGLRGKIDFVKLYNKAKYLRFANSPNPVKKRFTRNPGDEEDVEVSSSNVAKTFTRLLMSVRGIDYDYSHSSFLWVISRKRIRSWFWLRDGQTRSVFSNKSRRKRLVISYNSSN